MEVNTKELAPIKTQASKVLAAAEAVEVKTEEDLPKATDILHQIKTVQKNADTAKRNITQPLNEALKQARALFAPIEQSWKQAEIAIKRKMGAYHAAVEEERRKQEEALAKRVEAGRMRVDTAAKKMEAAPKVQTSVQGKKGEVQFRTVKKVEVTDAAQLPRDYLVPDMVKIRKDALAGRQIPGVIVKEEKQIAAY